MVDLEELIDLEGEPSYEDTFETKGRVDLSSSIAFLTKMWSSVAEVKEKKMEEKERNRGYHSGNNLVHMVVILQDCA